MHHRSAFRPISIVGILWLLGAVGSGATPGKAPAVPVPIPIQQSLQARWLKKPVLATQIVDNMEQLDNWSLRSPGLLTLSGESFKAGHHSISLQASTDRASAFPAGRDAGSIVVARRTFSSATDWSSHNRLSFWVYPKLGESKDAQCAVRLSNAGETDPEYRACFRLRPGEWNQVIWEIGHLERGSMTFVDFESMIPPDLRGRTNAQFFLDELEIQRVDADSVAGWAVASNRIAFSSSGYQVGSRKIAVASKLAGKEFKVLQLGEAGAAARSALIPIEKGRVVLTKELAPLHAQTGDYLLLDFSEVRQPGWYALRAGAATTEPFLIGDACWEPVTRKLLYFLDTALQSNPAFSDAPTDMASAVYALFDLAKRTRSQDLDLSQRVTSTAREGWSRLSQGRPFTPADPAILFGLVATEVAAAHNLTGPDTNLIPALLEWASHDWSSGWNRPRSSTLDEASAGTLAALELFRMTGEQEYASRAREFAQVIVQCQERLDQAGPLAGFFYTSPSHENIVRDRRDGAEDNAIVALTQMCATFPQHTEWMLWYSTVTFYSEGLKALARFTEPYRLLSGSIQTIPAAGTPPAELQAGIKLDDRHLLRLFPPGPDESLTRDLVLSRSKAASVAAHLRQDLELVHLAEEQLRWMVGRNPFSRSALFGEGFDFGAACTPVQPPVGLVLAGVRGQRGSNRPFWPGISGREEPIFLRPASQWLSVLGEVAGPATVVGEVGPGVQEPVRFTEVTSGMRYDVRPEKGNARFSLQLPTGEYRVEQAPADLTIKLLPRETRSLNLAQPQDFSVTLSAESRTNLQIKIKAYDSSRQRFDLRGFNLALAKPEMNVEVNLVHTGSGVATAGIVQPGHPWILVVIPNGNLADRKEFNSSRAKP